MPQVSSQTFWIDTAHGQLFAQSWTPLEERGAPIVLLHDSLGCVALWRDFPEQLAQHCGRRVIAYDRLGFGRSAAYPGTLPLTFIQDEASGSFRALCQQLGLEQFVVMGHSVGGGMAVGCAAAHPQACQALITESAQAFVDSEMRASIRAADVQFAEPGQLERLKKYHGEKAQWVLRAWVDSWLAEAFRGWSLDEQLAQVRCPLLSLHGDHDEYGSRRHPERITALASGPATLQVLADCGHVPHREYPDTVLATISAFLAS
ncbi:alpha/beta hydrolase [Pseudomonas sp. UL073]|uniref:Alpha/beta hydrolase n=1 Tax=Zestomonas insulae TaxID=2809017 RepID=A0ABS2IBG9_9GAMM|nr:alpha/beta hydrolase [Pseudomonas insulae]MBM7060302.1 alpha/beta hydrolase [Pseudomonas insulae]